MYRAVTNHLSQRADLGGHVDELLAAKSGVYSHHADQIGEVQKMCHRFGGGAGIEGNTGFHACTTDGLQGPMNMRAGLHMGGKDICARILSSLGQTRAEIDRSLEQDRQESRT